jgi:lipopolysaccharide biosynthesis regulator YciM
MDSTLGWLLFPLGTALGFYLARRNPKARPQVPTPEAGMLAGISTQAFDDPDQAVAALLADEHLTEEAVELHLTLGSLFRRRGQVDRALRVHEALLTRPSLTPAQRNRTEFELAEDYFKAGVLDRAEKLFTGLADRGFKLLACLESIIAIYENLHEWERAIEASRRLEAASGQSRRTITAQYYCEQAEDARRAKDPAKAEALAAKAQSHDKGCARASLVHAKICEDAKDLGAAASAYALAAERDPRLLADIVRPLWICCRDGGKPENFVQWLEDLPEDERVGATDAVRAELLRESGMDPSGYLLDAFERRPNWAVLEQIAQLDAPADSPLIARTSASLKSAVTTLVRARSRYQCNSCGMKPAQLFWQCPSCKQWGTVLPAEDRLEVPTSPLP